MAADQLRDLYLILACYSNCPLSLSLLCGNFRSCDKRTKMRNIHAPRVCRKRTIDILKVDTEEKWMSEGEATYQWNSCGRSWAKSWGSSGKEQRAWRQGHFRRRGDVWKQDFRDLEKTKCKILYRCLRSCQNSSPEHTRRCKTCKLRLCMRKWETVSLFLNVSVWERETERNGGSAGGSKLWQSSDALQ